MTDWQRRLRRIYLTALGVVVLGVLLSLWQGAVAYGQFRRVNRGLAAERATERAESAWRPRWAEVQATHDELLSDIGALEPTPPRQLYTSGLLRQLDQLAAQTNLSVIGCRPEPAVGDPPLLGDGPWRYVATVRGRYNDLLAFIDRLQQFPKLVALQTLTVAAEKGHTDGLLRADLGLLAREAAGMVDTPTLTTLPTVPPQLVPRFDETNVGALLGILPEPAWPQPVPPPPGPWPAPVPGMAPPESSVPDHLLRS